MMKQLVLLFFLLTLNKVYAQISIVDIGDGWKQRVDSAITLVKTYDYDKYEVLVTYCKNVGFWDGPFSSIENENSIVITKNDIKGKSLNNIAAILVHESKHLELLSRDKNTDENLEEFICYSYEYDFLKKIPEVEIWLLDNALYMLDYYSKKTK